MSQRDLIGLVASYVFAFGLLLGAEAVRRWRHWSPDFSRKLVHIGAGLWVWGILLLFDHWYIGIIPYTTFIALNYVSYRQQIFKAMDTAGSSPGTVYFSFSCALLLALFWRTGGAPDRASLAVAAIMAMTLGDAFAAIVGRRWGQRDYKVFQSRRTWLGSTAMAAFTFAGIALTLLLLPGSSLSPASVPLGPAAVLGQALVATAIATAAEALSPAGTDNLSVPLLTALALFLLNP